MPQYAAVDIGSNSVRSMVAEVAPGGKMQILAQDRQITRLGASVFLEGLISSDALALLADQLARTAQIFRKYDLGGLRAVATSAVRDANNQAEFLARTEAALGSPVEIISGQEEARLIHLGVQSQWPRTEGRTLIMDVGGGSMEFILSDQGTIAASLSKPLGAVRLTEVFLRHDPPTELELHRMDEYIEEKLAEPLERIAPSFDRCIATSATASAIVCSANAIPRSRRNEADRMRAGTAQIRELYQELSGLDLAERRKKTGIGPKRAELIIAGAAVFLRALEAFGLDALYYSAAGVRDGIIADLDLRGVGRDRSQLSPDQKRVVDDLAKRYGVQMRHVRRVAAFAQELFIGLQALHKLPPHYGKMLEAAGFLHDIGHFVSNTGHHRHSHYLVANSDLPGFTDAERRMIAHLCRYHRKTPPHSKHAFFQTINPVDRKAIILLTPLLRLADSLDRSHDQRVDRIRAEFRSGQVLIGLESQTDTDLELWAAERNADLFRATYDVSLEVARTKG